MGARGVGGNHLGGNFWKTRYRCTTHPLPLTSCRNREMKAGAPAAFSDHGVALRTQQKAHIRVLMNLMPPVSSAIIIPEQPPLFLTPHASPCSPCTLTSRPRSTLGGFLFFFLNSFMVVLTQIRRAHKQSIRSLRCTAWRWDWGLTARWASPSAASLRFLEELLRAVCTERSVEHQQHFKLLDMAD